MEWYPSDKMTVDDLKAVLMSWRIEIPHKASKDALQKLVGKEFKAMMQRHYGYAPIKRSVRAVAPSSCAAASDTLVAPSSCAAADKSVGTDLPAMVTSYIGSEAGSDADSDLIINELIINHLTSLPNKRTAINYDTPASAAVAEPEVTQTAACASEVTQTAACAAEVVLVPSLRRALDLEIAATAKAKAQAAKDKKDKKTAKEKKSSGKGYGYLPIGSFSIDADQKKDGDKNPGDNSA